MAEREPNSTLPDGSHAEDRDSIRERLKLARKWAYLVSKTAYVPLPYEDLERQLHDILNDLYQALLTEPFHTGAAVEAGARLVALNCSDTTSLQCTVDVLGKSLLTQEELRHVAGLPEKVVTLIGALAAGYAETMRLATFDQQENLKLALLKAVRDAKYHLRISEAQFDEVATCTSSGIVITDLDGRFVRTNAAFGEILDYTGAQLGDVTLFDVVHPDEAEFLTDAYKGLLDGRLDRLRQGFRLMRKDGEVARVSLAATVLRGADDRPEHFVTVVEDGTELTLLRNELSRQALHDVLTGLPNRQFFTTRLESVLRRADPDTGTTLYHLDLDAFSLITGGLGRKVGDLLLIAVAERLKLVVADEKAMVARFDGDEFAILVENTPTTPDVMTIIAMINDELSEPLYIDGHGVAATASIGVVHRPPRDMDPSELLRASDMTLRRAKSSGRRQWELFHPDQHSRDRQAFSLAAEMPGAWETGELGVVYQPLVRLADGEVVGVEAMMNWTHPDLGTLPAGRCLELAENTGLILLLGPWLLRTACEQVRWWHQRFGRDLPLSVNLTANQSSDADLVGEVGRIVKQTGMRPDLLRLGMPVRALLASHGEAMDNLKLLAENGIGAVAVDFGGAPGDLVCVEDLPLRAVRIARWLVERDKPDGSPVARSLAELSRLVHLTGTEVIVDGILTQAQADWWLAVGADTAQGELYAAPAQLDDIAPT